MEYGDKLYPEQIKDQCDSAIKILEQDNADIQILKQNLQNFITDDELVSQAYSTLKTQINDYLYVTSAMISANEMDIADIKTLKESVGKEDLLGDVIIPNKYDAKSEMESHYEMAEAFRKRADAEDWDSILKPAYIEGAWFYEGLACFAQKRYEKWKEKEEKFDQINFQTKNLCTKSATFRDAAKRGLESITNAFQNGTYVIDAGASWRADICMENAKKVEAAKRQFMMQNEDGEWVYDWDKIKDWLFQEPEEVTDLEYLAFIDLMSGMTDTELERLILSAQKYINVFSVACEISEVMRIASEKYLVIAQMEAELTIFDEHSKYEYDAVEITNELSRAFLIYHVVDSLSGSARKYVDISYSEDGTYVAKLRVSFDATGNAGDAIAADMSGETITIYPWKENKILQGYLNDCERVSFCTLDSAMGEVLKDATVSEVTGYIFGKIGNVTIDEFGGLLSYSASAANLVLDMKENYERKVTIKGGLTIIDTRETIDALGIDGGVISVAGGFENSVQIICPKYDLEELYVRVQAYNNANAGDANFVEITTDELKDAFTNEGELLQDYVNWYWKEGGAEDIDDYWEALDEIAISYRAQNPGVLEISVKDMNIEQIQELIKKKNDASYQINTEIMIGE